jgi:hypothetical protein
MFSRRFVSSPKACALAPRRVGSTENANQANFQPALRNQHSAPQRFSWTSSKHLHECIRCGSSGPHRFFSDTRQAAEQLSHIQAIGTLRLCRTAREMNQPYAIHRWIDLDVDYLRHKRAGPPPKVCALRPGRVRIAIQFGQSETTVRAAVNVSAHSSHPECS